MEAQTGKVTIIKRHVSAEQESYENKLDGLISHLLLNDIEPEMLGDWPEPDKALMAQRQELLGEDSELESVKKAIKKKKKSINHTELSIHPDIQRKAGPAGVTRIVKLSYSRPNPNGVLNYLEGRILADWPEPDKELLAKRQEILENSSRPDKIIFSSSFGGLQSIINDILGGTEQRDKEDCIDIYLEELGELVYNRKFKRGNAEVARKLMDEGSSKKIKKYIIKHFDLTEEEEDRLYDYSRVKLQEVLEEKLSDELRKLGTEKFEEICGPLASEYVNRHNLRALLKDKNRRGLREYINSKINSNKKSEDTISNVESKLLKKWPEPSKVLIAKRRKLLEKAAKEKKVRKIKELTDDELREICEDLVNKKITNEQEKYKVVLEGVEKELQNYSKVNLAEVSLIKNIRKYMDKKDLQALIQLYQAGEFKVIKKGLNACLKKLRPEIEDDRREIEGIDKKLSNYRASKSFARAHTKDRAERIRYRESAKAQLEGGYTPEEKEILDEIEEEKNEREKNQEVKFSYEHLIEDIERREQAGDHKFASRKKELEKEIKKYELRIFRNNFDIEKLKKELAKAAYANIEYINKLLNKKEKLQKRIDKSEKEIDSYKYALKALPTLEIGYENWIYQSYIAYAKSILQACYFVENTRLPEDLEGFKELKKALKGMKDITVTKEKKNGKQYKTFVEASASALNLTQGIAYAGIKNSENYRYEQKELNGVEDALYTLSQAI